MKHLFLALALVLLAGCDSTSYGGSHYENNEEIGNPYDEDSGHGAGYEWAERTGGDCNGKSDSFNDGCETFYEQMGY